MAHGAIVWKRSIAGSAARPVHRPSHARALTCRSTGPLHTGGLTTKPQLPQPLQQCQQQPQHQQLQQQRPQQQHQQQRRHHQSQLPLHKLQRLQQVQAQPVQAQPVQAQPVQAQPVQAQPVQAQPVQAQPWFGGGWGRTALSAAASALLLCSNTLLPPGAGPGPAWAHGPLSMEEHTHTGSSGGGPGASMAMAGMAGGCSGPSAAERLDAYGDLGGFHHPISTSSPEAQRLFDQGLLLAWNFNQPEAANSFRAALEFDPDCAMCHWGVAYAQAPYANKVAAPPPEGGTYPVFTQEELQVAQDSVQRAASLVTDAKEEAYVAAMTRRYQGGTYGASWEQAEREFADSMLQVAQEYGDNDAAAMAAEALMNLSPWDFYDPATGEPRPITLEAGRILEDTLQADVHHPLAGHMYVHLTEGGPTGYAPDGAGRAEAAADDLVRSWPSMGHLTHMPSHNYYRTGRWHSAVLANKAAIQADVADGKRCLEPYMPEHNALMLQYAAGMGGEVQAAQEYAQLAVTYPDILGPNYNMMSSGQEWGMLPVLWTRYAMWDNILALQPPPASSGASYFDDRKAQFAQVTFHYARAMAWAAKAKAASGVDSTAVTEYESKALADIAQLQRMVDAMDPDYSTKPGQGIGIYGIGWKGLSSRMLLLTQAKLAAQQQDWEGATSMLQQVRDIDVEQGYTEPPRAFQPTLDCLGWALLQQGQASKAIDTFLTDLKEYPNNAWALKGLQQAYAAAAAAAEGAESRQRWSELEEEAGKQYQVAWQYADEGLQLGSSCPALSNG